MNLCIALIGPDNVAFLCELLDEIGRKDLTDKVKIYIDKMEGKHSAACYISFASASTMTKGLFAVNDTSFELPSGK